MIINVTLSTVFGPDMVRLVQDTGGMNTTYNNPVLLLDLVLERTIIKRETVKRKDSVCITNQKFQKFTYRTYHRTNFTKMT